MEDKEIGSIQKNMTNCPINNTFKIIWQEIYYINITQYDLPETKKVQSTS